jgi:hypothetical protein
VCLGNLAFQDVRKMPSVGLAYVLSEAWVLSRADGHFERVDNLSKRVSKVFLVVLLAITHHDLGYESTHEFAGSILSRLQAVL